MATSMNNPVPAGFDALPVLDLRDPNFTIEGNRFLAELRQRTGLSRGTVAGIEVPFGCRAGSCGTCEVEVLAGKIIHRDTIASAAERAEGKKMMVCVSRGEGSLTLGL